MIEILLVLVGILAFNRIEKYNEKPNKIVINDLYTCVSSDKKLINGSFVYEFDVAKVFR